MSETAASLEIAFVLTVRVPQLVGIGPNAARREHHMARARRVKRERGDVALMLSQYTPPKRFGAFLVTMTRQVPRFLDDDGAVFAMKGVRDEIAKWLGLDDGDPRVTWRVEQEKAARKTQGTVLKIEGRA